MHDKLPQFQMQKMPHELDQKIRASFVDGGVWEQVGHAFRLRSLVWPSLSVATIAAFVLVSQHSAVYAEKQLWTAVLEADVQTQLDLRKGIAHQKFTIQEGQGKPMVVAMLNDLPLEQVVQVAKRIDTVEIYSHDINALVKAEKNIDLDPTRVTLNLENEDHLHLFESSTANCHISNDCASLTLTQTELTHRKLFDEVHDIASNYDQFTDPKLRREFAILPKMELVDYNDQHIIFRHHVDATTFVDYHFDARSYERKEEVIFAAHDDIWYEMARKSYLVRDIVPATEFATIFDPAAYGLEQSRVIPL